MINCEQPLLARADIFGVTPRPDLGPQEFAALVVERLSHLFNMRKNSSAVMPDLGLRETMNRLQNAREMGRRAAGGRAAPGSRYSAAPAADLSRQLTGDRNMRHCGGICAFGFD